MYITELKLSNFRNYGEQQLKLSPNINLIVGKNGQGKTNLIEAIYYSAIGKSPKTTKDTDLINWSKDKANFSLKVEKNAGSKNIEIIFLAFLIQPQYIFPEYLLN